MYYIFRKPFLPPAELSKLSLDGAGAFRHQLRAQFVVMSFAAFEFPRQVNKVLTPCGRSDGQDVSLANINTNDLLGIPLLNLQSHRD